MEYCSSTYTLDELGFNPRKYGNKVESLRVENGHVLALQGCPQTQPHHNDTQLSPQDQILSREIRSIEFSHVILILIGRVRKPGASRPLEKYSITSKNTKFRMARQEPACLSVEFGF